MNRAVPLLAALLSLAACDDIGREAPLPPGARLGPSGFAVPRYVSLRFDRVNARAGPSEDHPVVWTYRTRGLPVQVIAETQDWRRICDPTGQVAWVHKRTTEGRRTALRVSAQPLELREEASSVARVTARLQARSIASVESCTGGWCELSVGGASGWAPAAEVWGAADSVQCLAPDLRRAREQAAAR